MAGGNLTAREFWQLSPEERLKRCGELSEHEAYVARITDPCIEKIQYMSLVTIAYTISERSLLVKRTLTG